MEVCISFSEIIGFSVNVEAVRWRRMYSIDVSESICLTCNYGRCQDGDGCTVLVFQKTFASLVNMDAVRMKTDIQYWPFRKHYLRL